MENTEILGFLGSNITFALRIIISIRHLKNAMLKHKETKDSIQSSFVNLNFFGNERITNTKAINDITKGIDLVSKLEEEIERVQFYFCSELMNCTGEKKYTPNKDEFVQETEKIFLIDEQVNNLFGSLQGEEQERTVSSFGSEQSGKENESDNSNSHAQLQTEGGEESEGSSIVQTNIQIFNEWLEKMENDSRNSKKSSIIDGYVDSYQNVKI